MLSDELFDRAEEFMNMTIGISDKLLPDGFVIIGPRLTIFCAGNKMAEINNREITLFRNFTITQSNEVFCDD
jgi:hypothetical protein